MYVLGKEWSDSILDYANDDGGVRIQVVAWANIARAKGLYFERPRSVGMLWEYLKEFGVRAVVLKVRSRMGEGLRNRAFYSVGLGRVVDAKVSGEDADVFVPNAPVAFIAPSAPECVERVVLPPSLIRATTEDVLSRFKIADGIAHFHDGPRDALDETLFGWHPMSGETLDAAKIDTLFRAADSFWNDQAAAPSVLPLSTPTKVRDTHTRKSDATSAAAAPTGVVFGLGNYAKTQIIPNVQPMVRIETVHELNPAQIGDPQKLPWTVTTRTAPLDDREHDVYFMAGYHHTHAPRAITALERGAVAVVEKPLVTTRGQLDDLVNVLKRHDGRLFTCYHMRYNPLFALAKTDLQVGAGDPVHSCCDVFEVDLPPHHWYRWPNSGSHLISNGCHWIDHFLFMNDYSPPTKLQLIKSSNNDSTSVVELENGAVLTLHLTHVGSPRIGVQDHVVLRSGDKTVTVMNGSDYLAEDGPRLRRRKRINRMNAYRRMYREVASRIARGEPGDSLHSIEVMNRLLLDLEESWRDA